MNSATKSRYTRIWTWLIWALVVLVMLTTPPALIPDGGAGSAAAVTLEREEAATLYPRRSRSRWKKGAWRRYQRRPSGPRPGRHRPPYRDHLGGGAGRSHTPSNKRKVKLGLNVLAGSLLPGPFQIWSGRTADQATVSSNIEKLRGWLRRFLPAGTSPLIVGDRAMLNDALAFVYADAGLDFLAGLSGNKKEGWRGAVRQAKFETAASARKHLTPP